MGYPRFANRVEHFRVTQSYLLQSIDTLKVTSENVLLTLYSKGYFRS